MFYEKKFRIEATKIAKRLNINMFFCTSKLIEIVEVDKEKAREFAKEISKINKRTSIIDLVESKQHIDSKGNDIRGSKALYLTDDDYYNKLISEKESYIDNLKIMKENQISLFG